MWLATNIWSYEGGAEILVGYGFFDCYFQKGQQVRFRNGRSNTEQTDIEIRLVKSWAKQVVSNTEVSIKTAELIHSALDYLVYFKQAFENKGHSLNLVEYNLKLRVLQAYHYSNLVPMLNLIIYLFIRSNYFNDIFRP